MVSNIRASGQSAFEILLGTVISKTVFRYVDTALQRSRDFCCCCNVDIYLVIYVK